MLRKNKQQGFTLVELLITIAIIGMLVTIILTSFALVRSKARDAKRISDIRQLNSAIQFYINEYGHAPYIGGLCTETSSNTQCQAILDNTSNWNVLGSDLSQYIAAMPKDPQSTTTGTQRYIYYPPAWEAYNCTTCGPAYLRDKENYAIFVSRIENYSPILTFIFQSIPTFGFGSHNSYIIPD